MKIKKIEKLINEYNELDQLITEAEKFTTSVGESLCNRHGDNARKIKMTPKFKEDIDGVVKKYIEGLTKRRNTIKETLEE